MAAQCKARTKTGARCPSYAVRDSEFCLTHAPERAKERAARNRRGGLARTTIPKVAGAAVHVEKVEDVLTLINAVIKDTWEQENSAPRSRALLSAADMALKSLQIGELEERVSRLEGLISEGKVR